jgi:hypothetical protein|nr:MAG TPA: hypothetical protein [Caudoviricetes sp.]
MSHSRKFDKIKNKVDTKILNVESNYSKLRGHLKEDDTEDSHIAELCRKNIIDANYYLEKFIKITANFDKVHIRISGRENNVISDESVNLILSKLKESENYLKEIKVLLPKISTALDHIEKSLKESQNFDDKDHHFLMSLSGILATFCITSGKVISTVEANVKKNGKEIPAEIISAMKTLSSKHRETAQEMIRLNKRFLEILPDYIWVNLGIVAAKTIKSSALNLYEIGVLVDEYIVEYEDVRFPGL